MRICYFVTPDPLLARLARVSEITARMGFTVKIATRLSQDRARETDIVVIDARGEARDLFAQFTGLPLVRRRRRVVVIMDESASSEQRAAFIDAGVLSAVPANPARLAELLADALQDCMDDPWP